MYLKMYIKSERFYQQPENQGFKEDKYYSDYEEELEEQGSKDLCVEFEFGIWEARGEIAAWLSGTCRAIHMFSNVHLML
ncbi:unnamed protein product [Plutella xylostella]|uniref:(diamondback moth) hypothetical protein n=1 Tax=Plutella xylostella TaxID=51655 RepID=A0A8S4DPG1_PLUXY|nr:unnamed protein product [Plutella xylostella]